MKLTGSLCNIKVILKETVDCCECVIIKSFWYIRTKDFLQKILTESDRELINQPADSEFIIRKYSLF